MQHYRTHMSPKSRKSNKRTTSTTTITTSTASSSSSSLVDDSRPRPRLHAHHRIQFGVERPLTIDQHLNNYHQSLSSPERFSSVRYDNNNNGSNPIKTSVTSSTDSFTNITARNGKDSFYHHQLSLPNNNTNAAHIALRSHVNPSPPPPTQLSSSSPSPSATQIDHDNNESDRRETDEKTDGLLQLAHVVSTFGWKLCVY